MTAQKKTAPKPEPKKENPKALKVTQQPTETAADAMARTSLNPTIQAALTLMDYNKHFGELSINTLVDDLGKQCELASNGDLKRAEALLMAQAHTLDAIFNNLARRAINSEYLAQFEPNLKFALRAQSQSRATLETLALLKNPPPIAFVRQANIANGPQQVNNGTVPAADAPRARENQTTQSKLLEEHHGARLDLGKTQTASAGDLSLEAVGAIHRTENARRQG